MQINSMTQKLQIWRKKKVSSNNIMASEIFIIFFNFVLKVCNNLKQIGRLLSEIKQTNAALKLKFFLYGYLKIKCCIAEITGL